MGVRSYDHIEITGLVASGTADNAGAWNTNVDLDSFATIPAGATAAIFVVNQLSGQARWTGFRKPGATNPETLVDAAQSQSRNALVPLGAGNTVDIYLEDPAGVRVYLVAVVDWVVKSADETRETFSLSSAWQNYTLTSAPAGTIGIFANAQSSLATSWRPFGSSATPALGIGRMTVPVDGSYRFSARASSTETLIVNAYITSGATWPDVDSVSETFTADSTWRTSAMTAVGKQFAQIRRPDGSDSTGVQFRKSGSSYNPASTFGTFFEWQFTPVGADGNFQYWLETGATQTTYYLTALFDDFPAAGLSNRTTASNSDGLSCTLNIPVGSGNNRVAVAIATQYRNTVTIESITLNGVAGTQIGTVTSADSLNRAIAFIWLDADLPASSGNYTVATSGLGVDIAISAISYSGASQDSTPAFASVANNSGATSISLNPTLTAGAIFIGATAQGAMVTNGGQTDVLANTNSGNANHAYSYKESSGAIGYVQGSGGNAAIAVAIEAAPTGGLSITSIVPSQIDDGESFTINGTGFGASQGLSLVQIGGVTQPVTSWGPSQIVCTATRGSQSMGNATLTIYKM